MNTTTLNQHFKAHPGLHLQTFKTLASGNRWERLMSEMTKYPHLQEIVDLSWMYRVQKMPTKAERSLCFLSTVENLLTPEQFAQSCSNINFDMLADKIRNPTKFTFDAEFPLERGTATERMDVFLARKPDLVKDIQRSMAHGWKDLFYTLSSQPQLNQLLFLDWADDIEFNDENPGGQGALFLLRISKLVSVKEFEAACRSGRLTRVADLLCC